MQKSSYETLQSATSRMYADTYVCVTTCEAGALHYETN